MDRAGNRVPERSGGAGAPLSVLNISPRTDIGGDGHRTALAFRKHGWTYRHASKRANNYGFPADLSWKEAQSAYWTADVIHHRQMFAGPPRPEIIQHHGSYARQHRDRLIAEQEHRRAIGIVSTLDLYLLGLGEWIGAPYDLDWLASFRRPSDILTIAHAGTNPESKSTGPFLAACERLSKEVELRVLHIAAPWHECLRLKGTADIYFDQVLTGYGNNAVEAMGMGIPVIAGIEPAEARKRGHLIPDETPDEMDRRFGGMPFVRADEGTIYDALRLLVEPSQRRAWADRGSAHARRFHDERMVVRQLEDIYRRAVS